MHCACDAAKPPHECASDDEKEQPRLDMKHISDILNSDGAKQPAACNRKQQQAANRLKRRRGQTKEPARLRKRQRDQRRFHRDRLKARKDDEYVAPPSIVQQRKGHWTGCCLNNCTRAYERTGASTVLRQYGRSLDEQSKRTFVIHRITEEYNPEPNTPQKTYYMERPDDIMETHSPSLKPKTSLNQVCRQAFLFLCCGSSTLLDQPTNHDRAFSEDCAGGQLRAERTKPRKSRGLVAWLLFLATFYQFDPTSDHVYIPFASRQVVYDMYSADQLDPEYTDFFQGKLWGAVVDSEE